MDEIKDFYYSNEDFRNFVDKCMEEYNWSLEQALYSPITKEYYKYMTSC